MSVPSAGSARRAPAPERHVHTSHQLHLWADVIGVINNGIHCEDGVTMEQTEQLQ